MADIEIDAIRDIIKSNPIISRINDHIASYDLFECPCRPIIKTISQKIRQKKQWNQFMKYDYIFDGLNIEGGSMGGLSESIKIIKSRANNIRNKKILIVVRSPLRYQTTGEKKTCVNTVKKYKNIDIIYIHTIIKIKEIPYTLIESCKRNPYCTKREKKRSITEERLCVTPLVIERGMRPTHNMCEIDDLIIYYLGICYKSKIVSRHEKYSLNVKAQNIDSFKLFLNIPITYYSARKTLIKKNLYIDPLMVFKHLQFLHRTEPLMESQSIRIKKGILFA